jgi:hypothetical protein
MISSLTKSRGRGVLCGLLQPFNERAFAFDALLSSRFDIFQFPFQFNPGTNGGNVEMGLIKSYLMTLNQRVPGSSPGALTIT